MSDPHTKALELASAIMDARENTLATSNVRYRQAGPRASNIGECAREVYHQCVDWERRPAFDTATLARFDRGHEIERIVTGQLLRGGWSPEGSQTPFELRDITGEVYCSGHIDGRLRLADGTKPVYEIKSINPNTWAQINTAEDWDRQKSPFWRRYPNQLLLYLFATGEEYGLWILDDCLGHLKVVPLVLLEWADRAERVLQTALAAHTGIKRGTPPDYCGNAEVCSRCWCREVGVCQPPMGAECELGVLNDVELEEMLAEHARLEEDGREWKRLDEAIKARLKPLAAGMYVAGGFACEVKKIATTQYQVPAEVRAEYKQTAEQTRCKWYAVGG